MPHGMKSRMERIMEEQLPSNQIVQVSAAYAMKVTDHYVRVACSGAYSITLPPVAEAAGEFYLLRGISGTSTVTMVDKGDAAVAISDTMDAANEVAMFYSTGESWHFIITPP